jgi:RNA polymerase sigma-54 factor
VKQSLSQKQKLSLNITISLGKQIKLLSLSGFEISSQLNDLIDDYFELDDKNVAHFRDEHLIDRYRNILNSDNDFIKPLSVNNDLELQENLLNQLELTPLDNVQNLVGEFLIDSVLSNGRLDPELEYLDIKRIVIEDFNTQISDGDIDEVLKMIQNFDPPGCAFRNINESLLIQIENLEIGPKEKNDLISVLNNLIDGTIEIDKLPESLKKNLNRLSLNPAGSFGETTQNYIRPDVLAVYKKNKWLVSLNDEFMSKELLEKIKIRIESTEKEDTHDSKAFLKGLERRQQTLLLVSEYLIEAQRNFLNSGSGKRALANKEIAERLNISPSTVSRIVRNKYLQLPDNIIQLKELLEKRINKLNEGKDVTSEDLKFLLEKLVQSEDQSNPLSDENLKSALEENFEVVLSRRTITKYRLDLGIPSSKKRYLN